MNAARVVETDSAEATEAVGAEIASTLGPGDVVSVAGELGAGQDNAHPRRVPCARRHRADRIADLHDRNAIRGRLPVSHLDLYRLERLDAEDPGLLDDYLTDDAVAFVEWPAVADAAARRRRRASKSSTSAAIGAGSRSPIAASWRYHLKAFFALSAALFAAFFTLPAAFFASLTAF